MFIYPSDTIFLSTLKRLLMAKLIYNTLETPNKTSPPQLGSQYQGMLDANPYRNQEYKVTPWQAFLGALGFRTEADAWKENMAVQAAEYDASIAQKAYNEQFESPAAQVARMRAAGLNPDLDGGASINPQSASPMPEDPSTPMQSTGASGTLGELGNFANAVLSTLSAGVGIIGSFQGIEAKSLQNQVSRFQLQGDIAGYAEKMFPYMLPDSPSPAGMVNEFDWRGETLRRAQRFSKKLPRKTRKAFLDHIEQFWDSAPADEKAFQAFLDRARSRKEYYKETSWLYDEFDSSLRDLFEPLGELIQSNFKKGLEVEGKRLETEVDTLSTQEDINKTTRAENAEEREYLATHDAAAQGQAANQQYSTVSSSGELQEAIKDTMNKIVHNLQSTAEKGGLDGFFANVLLMLFSMNAEGMLPSAPNVSFSKKF